MRVALAVLTIFALGSAGLLADQERPPVPPGVTVAFVSAQRILAESNEGRSHLARIKTAQQERASDIAARYRALDATRRQLAATTDPAARAALQQEAQSQQSALERATGQAQVDLQALERKINGELQMQVRAVLDELLKGTEVTLVLSSDAAVVWGTPDLDLSAAVIERLNARPDAASTAPR